MDNLKDTLANQAQANLSAVRHQELIAHSLKVSDTVLASTEALIKYLQGHVTQTEVINQLESIGTPDVQYVVQALQVLDESIKSRPLTDLSQITALMTSLVDEAKAIPKELPVVPETVIPDYSEKFTELTTAIQAVTKAVEAQETTVEAPNVNVPAPVVNVDAPDLSPIQSSLVGVTKAVKAIVIPEYKTDNTEVEKLLKKSNKLLDQILDKPVGGGGGGSSRVSPYEDSTGMPAFVTLTQGAMPTTSLPQAQRISAPVASVTYIGKAVPGTLDSEAKWQIQKVDETSGTIITWADGNSAYDNIWANRASLTYS